MNKPSVLGVIVLLGCLFAVPAWPLTVIVTSNADSGANTLRSAIASANAGDTIKFALPGATITLASTLTLAKDVRIDGSGNAGLTISGNHAVQVLVVNAGVAATIENLTIADGASADNDTGGIHNLGTLTVANCTLSGNSGPNGGGISNEGTLTLTNSTLTGNSAMGYLGGGVNDQSGTATITSNTFVGNSANYGGGVFVSGVATATLANNVFFNNTATSFGGSAGASGVANADHNLYWNNADSSGPQGINCNACSSNTNAVNADPLLGTLANNGGPTRTYLPGNGSAAIGAGSTEACPATDQRGVARPQATGAVCDIGSVTVSTPCYVKAAATGANSGASWTDAFTDLQSALNDSACKQIWVAKGTYLPSSTTDRSASFVVPRGVSLYGGFAGSESQINPRSASNQTTLSGDIGTTGDVSDNSYHVVRLDGTTAAGTITTATNAIDGFTITGGNSNGAASDSRGAGLYCDGSGSGHECSPRLNNLDIAGNFSADWAGGAFFGGGAGKSSPLLTNSTFRGNSAQYGGGLMCFGQSAGDSSPTLGNVTFSGNTASLQGGALYNAAYSNGVSSPTLINVTFTGNVTFGQGAAIANDVRAAGHTFPLLSNVILWGDQAAADGEFHVENDTTGFFQATIQTAIIQSGCPAGATCSNVIVADPLLGPLANHGGLTQTVVPGPTGSAFDSGDDVTCGGDPIYDVDQRGFARPFSQHCDMGAVEFNDRIFANAFEAP